MSTAHGWTVLAHPLFRAQFADLVASVGDLKTRRPKDWTSHNDTKRLAAITKLAFDVIPQDPTRPEYRQGDTLGADNRHWFRAKFFQQYRLFFRFDSTTKLIILAWVNDDKSLRAYGSRSDAYRTFARMLDSGNPPGDWEELVRQSGEI